MEKCMGIFFSAPKKERQHPASSVQRKQYLNREVSGDRTTKQQVVNPIVETPVLAAAASSLQIVANLTCFKRQVNFEIPLSVKRSTTADIVRTGSTKHNKQYGIFGDFRKSSASAHNDWIIALYACNLASTPSLGGQDLLGIQDRERRGSDKYLTELLKMAQNGIWNCQEFADFALISIRQNEMLAEGYVAYTAYLNDVRIPEDEHAFDSQFFPQAAGNPSIEIGNHDHVFVVIENKGNRGEKFIVDLWQILASDTGKPFVGTCSAFIAFLNARPDGQYVRRSISEGEIQPCPMPEPAVSSRVATPHY